ncbi:hypothetical protein RJZ56_006553 [Blastomyces dermatitidis]
MNSDPFTPKAMEFIATNTTIPVPKVYETRWSGNRTRLSQIVMEYIPGESLDTAWGKLTHDQRMSVCRQLRGYLSQLQNLTSKTKRIEAANGGPITAGLRFPRRGGPFDSKKELNDFLVEKNGNEYLSVFRRYARAAMSDDHEIHFAHGDFSPRNIMVENGMVKAVLD